MKHLKKLLRKEEGFTLVELIVVIVIMGILAQIGLVSFNRYTRKTRAFAARTALRNIKSECEMNRDLGMDQTFTPLTPSGYSIQTSNTNSCLGESGSGLVSAIPENLIDYPSYFYNLEEGTISCSYSGSTDNLFLECETNNNDLGDSTNNTTDLLASLPEAIKNPCVNGAESGIKMYSYGPDTAWRHDCDFTDVNYSTGPGTLSSPSGGKLRLLSDGSLELNGPYSDLNAEQQRAFDEGGFERIYMGGYGSYAALRDDGSLLVMGMNSQDDIDAINTLLLPPVAIQDIQFSYGGGSALLENGQIFHWGNGGAYEDELSYRLGNK